ncbi:PIN domain-containing protein [Adlercreutzia sp. R7]|uniref:PIN domain-containing protein n=1 Tax=Adlercreutzia wanghongyangiae TaxID=3111451 RepID=A0ABU6IFX7_9ACTN|nr:PIN domain-containing protein [Adlercreutzia sp. R7]
MTKEHPTLLLDTNIWIDNYFAHREGSEAARELIAYANEQNYTLAYAATSTKDLFFLAGSELKRLVREEKGELSEEDARSCSDLTWAFLKNMTSIAVAIPVGEPQIWLATHYRALHGDFEDDLILAAAEESKADYLVTNDRALFGKAAIPVFTSADMLAYLKR